MRWSSLLTTPYYGISDGRGQLLIPHVPEGRYAMHIWYEAALPEQLSAMTREIAVTENNSTLGVLRLAAANHPETHKNKYGEDYDPPTPDSPAYPPSARSSADCPAGLLFRDMRAPLSGSPLPDANLVGASNV